MSVYILFNLCLCAGSSSRGKRLGFEFELHVLVDPDRGTRIQIQSNQPQQYPESNRIESSTGITKKEKIKKVQKGDRAFLFLG